MERARCGPARRLRCPWHLETRSMTAATTFGALRARTNAGEEIAFDAFAGKVVLIVNVARL